MPKPTRLTRRGTAADPAPSQLEQGSSLGLERVVFFSDAVMAIAITLLVLDIRLPEVAGDPVLNLGPRLLAMWPKYLSWAVSFWVIGLYWVAHHRCFRYIVRYDRRLMYLNFLFLMFIAFMPFPTTLLFTNGVFTSSVILYAGTAAGMGFSLAGMWLYAVRHRFVVPETPVAIIKDVRFNLLLPPFLFLVTMVVAVFAPGIATFSWLLMLPIYVLRRRGEAGIQV